LLSGNYVYLHLYSVAPLNKCRPMMLKKIIIAIRLKKLFPSLGKVRMRAPKFFFSLGTSSIIRKILTNRIVLTNSVNSPAFLKYCRMLAIFEMKSNQFQYFRKYVPFSKANPILIMLINISIVNNMVHINSIM